jgi:hypothetical protein
VSTREHAEHLRAFSARCLRAQREGDTATLAAIDAQHQALGFGGPVAAHVDAISACVPGAEVAGPYVRCVCGQRMPVGVWDRHVELAPGARSIHRWCLAGLGLDVETAPTIIEGELPEADDDETLPAWLFGAAS